MKILVLNCGSSSIKFQLIDMTNEEKLLKGNYERVGIGNSFLTIKYDGLKEVIEKPVKNHNEGIKVIFEEILNPKYGKLKSIDELFGIGHRIVHGGEEFAKSVIINEDVKKAIIKCIPLSPLHNPAGLAGIESCEKIAPNIKNVAVFDTAFHQTMPEVAYIYNIPYEYYEKYKIRKYGFHGTSHRYIAKRVSELLNRDDLKIISCHLGQGASIAAIKGNTCLDTTMGLTPLAGIPMGTRSGNIDPSIIPYLCKLENLTVDEVDTILNKKSGALGLSGISADFRDIEDAERQGNKRARLALDSNHYLVAQTIASYMATLNGVDVIVFTAGVGENGSETREHICSYLKFANVEIDKERNKVRGEEREISTESSKVKVFVIPTDEELMIAKDTMELLKK